MRTRSLPGVPWSTVLGLILLLGVAQRADATSYVIYPDYVLVALDAETGEELWRTRPPELGRPEIFVGDEVGVARSEAATVWFDPSDGSLLPAAPDDVDETSLTPPLEPLPVNLTTSDGTELHYDRGNTRHLVTRRDGREVVLHELEDFPSDLNVWGDLAIYTFASGTSTMDTGGGVVDAWDLAKGQAAWRFDANEHDAAIDAADLTNIAVDGDRVLVSVRQTAYALDAATGALLWRRALQRQDIDDFDSAWTTFGRWGDRLVVRCYRRLFVLTESAEILWSWDAGFFGHAWPTIRDGRFHVAVLGERESPPVPTGGRSPSEWARALAEGSPEVEAEFVRYAAAVSRDPWHADAQEIARLAAELSPSAAPALIEALGDKYDPPFELILALARAADEDAEARALLRRALSSSDDRTRARAAGVISRLRSADAMELLDELLDHQNEHLRGQASLALVQIEPGGVDVLLRAMEGDRPRARAEAMDALALHERNRPEVVAAFTRALGDRDASVVARAVEALEPLGIMASNHLDDDPAIRRDIEARSAESIASVEALLASEDPEIRHRAAATLVTLAVFRSDAQEALARALGHADPEVRFAAANGLGDARGLDASLVPRLEDATTDPDIGVRLVAERALQRQAPTEERVLAIAAALGNADPGVRAFAARILEPLGPDAAPAVSALIEALDDPEEEVRSEAVLTLRSIGPAAAPAIPKLVELMDEGTVGLYAISALRDLGPVAAEALPALESRLDGASRHRRQSLEAAISAIRGEEPRWRHGRP